MFKILAVEDDSDRNRQTDFFRALQNDMTFFLPAAFIVTCCRRLSVSILAEAVGNVFGKDDITAAATVGYIPGKLTGRIGRNGC